jgi:hypothetical protein
MIFFAEKLEDFVFSKRKCSAALTLVFLAAISLHPAWAAGSDQTQNKVRISTAQAMHRAATSPDSSSVAPCELALEKNDATNQEQIISAMAQHIRAHAARFANTPENQGNREFSPVFNAFFLQYSKDLITQSREQLNNILIKLSELWASAQRHKVEQVYRDVIATRGRHLQLEYRHNLPYDPQLFPAIARILDEPSQLELLPGGSLSSIRVSQAGNKKKATIYQVIQEMKGRPQWVSGAEAKDLEAWLSAELIKVDLVVYKERLRDLGVNVTQSIEGRIVHEASNGTGRIANWDDVLRIDAASLAKDWFDDGPKILKEALDFLNRNYPYSSAYPKAGEILALANSIDLLLSATAQEMLADFMVINDQKIILKTLAAQVQYNTALQSGQLSSIQGDSPNSPGVFLEILHGAGTTKSSVASLRTLIGLLASYGFNPNGIDNPDAGTGPRFHGDFLMTSRYLQEYLRQSAGGKTGGRGSGENRYPLLTLGRSMGATKVVADQILFENSAADMSFAMSFSNPMTLKEQTESVFNQLRNGTITGVVLQALHDADTYSDQFYDMVLRAQRIAPQSFATAGNLIVYLQGDDDEDARVVKPGQPDVLTALNDFRDRITPAGHIYTFHNPLAGNELLAKEDPEHMEATHFLVSNRDDLRPDQIDPESAWSRIPNENLPKLKSQTLEVFAVMYGSMDYIIAGLPNGAPWPFEKERQARDAMLRLRADLCGVRADGTPRTFFEWFVERINQTSRKRGEEAITIEQVRATPPGQRLLVERLSRAWHYWNVQEPNRVEAIYRANGLIE